MKKVVIPNAVMLGEVKKLLAEGRTVVILTKGLSMLPFIRGDKDSVVLAKAATIAPGDIALAEITPGKWVLHRVIEVEGEKVTLRGDGNIRGIENCAIGDVAGVVTEIRRPNGKTTDPRTAKARKRWHGWCSTPLLIRRAWLSFYRRVIVKFDKKKI